MMKNPDEMYRELLSLTDSEKSEALTAVLNGSPEAARQLIWHLPNKRRGLAVRFLFELLVPPEVLAAALDAAYEHNADVVINAFGIELLVEAFLAAEFPTFHLPKAVRVWRGTRLLPDRADIGLSWTLNYAVACWFALRPGRGTPCVYTRLAVRDEILAHSKGRQENEIVLPPISNLEQDPHPNAWPAAADEWEQILRNQNARRLQRLMTSQPRRAEIATSYGSARSLPLTQPRPNRRC